MLLLFFFFWLIQWMKYLTYQSILCRNDLLIYLLPFFHYIGLAQAEGAICHNVRLMVYANTIET